MRSLAVFRFLRITDEQQRLSITNGLVLFSSLLLFFRPGEITSHLALALSLALYAYKTYLAHKQQRDKDLELLKGDMKAFTEGMNENFLKVAQEQADLRRTMSEISLTKVQSPLHRRSG